MKRRADVTRSSCLWAGRDSWTEPAAIRDESVHRHPEVADPSVWVVVLAGGQGTRLQQFTQKILGSDRPKQFCCITGTRSMLRHTWDRALGLVPADRVVTVITAGQERYLAEEQRQGVPGTVLVQPANKETAAGLFLPLLWIARRDPEATVVVLPADHFVWEETRFLQHVRGAIRAADRIPDRLVLLGVEAQGPEKSYGWIVPAQRLDDNSGNELYAVERFWEKPDRSAALQLYSLDCLWNTLVIVGRLDTFLELGERMVPEVFEPLHAIRHCLGTPVEAGAMARAYRRCPSANLSRALLMACPESLLVLAVRGVFWSDWGDPERIVRTLRSLNRSPEWLLAYTRQEVADRMVTAERTAAIDRALPLVRSSIWPMDALRTAERVPAYDTDGKGPPASLPASLSPR